MNNLEEFFQRATLVAFKVIVIAVCITLAIIVVVVLSIIAG